MAIPSVRILIQAHQFFLKSEGLDKQLGLWSCEGRETVKRTLHKQLLPGFLRDFKNYNSSCKMHNECEILLLQLVENMMYQNLS